MDSETQKVELTCHQITSKDQSPETFHKLLHLAISIFEPGTLEQDSPVHHQLSTWESHISMPNASIFYVTDLASQPVGFFFVIPRTQPEVGYELLHIWLAGVDTASRGTGIFPFLTEKVKEHATNCGYREITVCTFPNRFDTMYRILGKNGWKEVAWPVKGEKVLMKLTL